MYRVNDNVFPNTLLRLQSVNITTVDIASIVESQKADTELNQLWQDKTHILKL